MRERLLRWGKILAVFFSAQGLAQLLSLSAGLIFVRTMAEEQFALYTLAASVIAFFLFLTDLGSTGSLVYFFHQEKGEREAFAPYRAAVASLRWAAFGLGALAVVAVFPWVSAGRGFTGPGVWLATVAVLFSVGFQVPASIQLLLLRLGGGYAQSYRAEVGGAAVRFLLALSFAALAWVPAWAAVGSGAAATLAVAWLSRPPPQPAPVATDLAPFRRRVLRYLLPTLPSAAYYAFQSQLVVWLAATFGSTRNLAEVGALGRLGLIFGLFSNLVPVVFLPHLAQIPDERLYLRHCLAFGGFLGLIAVGLLALAALGPGHLLWVLGASYAGLHHELLLVVAGAGLNLLGGYAVAVNAARSWNRWQSAATLILGLSQAGLAVLLPLSTTAGLLSFNLGTAAVGLLLQVITLTLGFARPRWVHW